MWAMIKTYSGVAILAVAMLYAVVRVAINQITYEDPDVTTLRICHWQLESGFREALQDLIDDYEQMYAEKHDHRIRILQVPISERGYKQYVNTSLIGGTAPDIIEKGMAKSATDPSYVARFFVPLGNYLEEPNPYNEGTPLEGVPWRNTFHDGMQSAFSMDLLDYYHVPFSMFTMRIYFNVDMYRELTGRTVPPQTWNELKEVAERVWQKAEEEDRPLVPVAGSKTTGNYFRYNYGPMFLFDLVDQTDLDFSGTTSLYEAYKTYREGKWSFDSDRFEAMWSCLQELSGFFQKGWTAALRDDAVFMFVQERSLMYVSGSWDAQSVIDQTDGRFEIGVFDFPIPSDHPEYGQFVKGLTSEAATGGGIPWSITKQSPHKDIAVDFLRFCTTRDNNQQFNESINWLPVVRGTEMTGILKAFKPRIRGYTGHFDYNVSTTMRLKGEGQLYSLFAGGTTLEEYIENLTDVYERTAVEGMEDQLIKDRRNNRNLDRILAANLVNLAFRESVDQEDLGESIQQVILATQNFNDLEAMNQQILEQAKEESN